MIYLAAILGSLVFIMIRLKIEKQKSDDNSKYHFRLKQYALKEWDDWAFSILIGLIMVFFMEDDFRLCHIMKLVYVFQFHLSVLSMLRP